MNLLNGITHIIFDLDGTLIDSEPLWAIAENRALAPYGKQVLPEVAKTHIGLRVDEAARIMVNAYQVDVDSDDFADSIYDHMMELIEEKLVLIPGANEIIEALHKLGYPLAIASSSAEHYILAIVDKAGWSEDITVVTSAYNVPLGKPAPDVYLEAARLLGADPTKCLALEDSINGAKAAQAAGMRTVAIPGHGFTSADFEGVADQTFPTLLDMVSCLPH